MSTYTHPDKFCSSIAGRTARADLFIQGMRGQVKARTAHPTVNTFNYGHS